MSITDRDRKILMVIVPLLCVLAYWFLILSPKRQEAATAQEKLAEQQERRDMAEGRLSQLTAAKNSFVSDYADIVRLGKAIPASLDMPGLLVQLDEAADGTGIDFNRIAAGQRQGAPGQSTSTGASSPPAPGTGNGSQPAAAGGAPAQSTTGQNAEKAHTTAGNANASAARNESATASGVNPTDAQTSTGSKQAGVPVGGAAGGSSPPGSPGSGSPGAPGLESVPLQFEFKGSFFNLADFFHRLKRFVRVANGRIATDGRLMTIDTFKFSSDDTTFPGLKAEVSATVYLTPKAEGTTAGATPQGPAATTRAAGPGSTPSAPTTPTAAPPAAAATP